ncbi:prepilin-type N-terminal cleavage/methylation domain-containing protein [Stenotrophomonas maltophilia]|nr:prepilin-type N-terminal cleavage/methylation domain-containing protein [Stenotrophomonas maltophilia]
MHRTPAHCRSASRGVHLVEMLVVIAVLAVLLTVSWPAMRSMLLQQRSESTRFNLQSGLATARSQAITRRALIGLCASRDGHQCGSDWSEGWIVYKTDGGRKPPSSVNAILLHQAGHPNISIHATSNSGRPQLYFQPDGRSPGANLTLRICADGRERSRVIVSNSGRVRSTRSQTDQPC